MAVQLADGAILPLAGNRAGLNASTGRAVTLGIRPQHFSRDASQLPGRGAVRLSVKIELVQPTGARAFITFPLGGTAVMAELAAHDAREPGETIELYADMNRAIVIDPESGKVL
jgi:multiple sugar transport system ATP-binding protein